MHEYTLIRSKRKTVALYIRPGAVIEVRAPLKMPRADIDSFVASKESWLNKRLPLAQERQHKRAAFCLDYGNVILVRGMQYHIVSKPGSQIGFDDEQFYIPPNLTPEQIKSACVQIYKMIARQVLINRTIHFAKMMGIMPGAVKINSAKTRWGSCSVRKNINYSWRLIMAEDNVIDYVVVHELAHITQMNHSDKFWRIVSGVLPDYKARRERLNVLQQRLSGEDWG